MTKVTVRKQLPKSPRPVLPKLSDGGETNRLLSDIRDLLRGFRLDTGH